MESSICSKQAAVGGYLGLTGIWIGIAEANIIGAIYAGRLLKSWIDRHDSKLAGSRPTAVTQVSIHHRWYKHKIHLVLLLAQFGCVSFPGDMSGRYDAHNGDFIIVSSNGDLYWSPMSKTNDKLLFVGTVGENTESDVKTYLAISSNSPFFNTAITYTQNRDKIIIEWSEFSAHLVRGRSLEYLRIENKRRNE